MARTIIGVNDARAVKKWSGNLALDTSLKSYFNKRFMAPGAEAEVPVQILTDLESDAGEEIKYDLLAELTMAPIEGEDTLEGNEEKHADDHEAGLHYGRVQDGCEQCRFSENNIEGFLGE